MSLFSIILLFFPQIWATTSPNLTAGCRPGTIAECRNALFVPGHTLLGDGINILTMKPTGSFLVDMQDVDNECTVCNNPYEKNVLQKLPKAMVDWRPQPSCSKNIISSIYRSVVSLANEGTDAVNNDWKEGLYIPTKYLNYRISVGGSHSKNAKFAESKSISDKYSFLSHKVQCTLYSFGLSKEPALTKSFTDYLMKLPASYNAGTKAMYRRLINHFGTHYITKAQIGGWAQEVTALRTCEVALYGMSMREVKDCLSVEAQISTNAPNSHSMDAEMRHCSQKARKANRNSDYHQTFNERVWQVIGGQVTSDLLSGKRSSSAFDKWVDSLKTMPGLVTTSLDPIYNLVRCEGPKKDNLRRAINDYIEEKSLKMKCSCPGRSYVSPGEDCSCGCQDTKHINSDCCPTNRGQAKLHVTVKKANGLHGDYFTKTDAYVKIKFESTSVTTQTISNDDNPQWNIEYDFNIVDLAANKKITVEVWDEDNESDDDLLGKCEEAVTSGDVSRICYLNHGSITYSLSARCVTHLQGPYCQNYSPSPS